MREGSVRRLGVECIDVYLLHRRDYPLEQVPEMVGVLEDLVRAGRIRAYGWSTDDVERARAFALGAHCIAIEHRLNVFHGATAMLDLCREHDLASLNRIPLLMGVLTGRWSERARLLERDDARAPWFEEEAFRDLLAHARGLTRERQGRTASPGGGCVGRLGRRRRAAEAPTRDTSLLTRHPETKRMRADRL
jgi:aryl-alcohol dehydrogenase-like predicted oxidoreductase